MERDELKKQFNKLFQKTPKGNYYSPSRHITIFCKEDGWRYVKNDGPKSHFGKNVYPKIGDCFEALIKNKIIRI
jgi:hypothetical protein